MYHLAIGNLVACGTDGNSDRVQVRATCRHAAHGVARVLPGLRLRRSREQPQGSGCPVQGSGCPVQGSGCPVQGSGCPVQGSGCPVQGERRAMGGVWSVLGPCLQVQGVVKGHAYTVVTARPAEANGRGKLHMLCVSG